MPILVWRVKRVALGLRQRGAGSHAQVPWLARAHGRTCFQSSGTKANRCGFRSLNEPPSLARSPQQRTGMQRL